MSSRTGRRTAAAVLSAVALTTAAGILAVAASSPAAPEALIPAWQPAPVDLAAAWRADFAEIERTLAWYRKSRLSSRERMREQSFHPAAWIDDTDRDAADVVLRRAAALIDHLAAFDAPPDLTRQRTELDRFRSRAASLDVADTPARYALYEEVCRLRRSVAFANPLLDFDRLLFVKRARAGYNHMCDQYFGFHAVKGGGLFVLRDPFGDTPAVCNLLDGVTVERGRLAGQPLAPGAFLSPDLDFDGRRIAFAYVEQTGKSRPFTTPWSFHVFTVNADGTGLAQLTDGPYDDFDPCWLPNGRLAFISRRRGGYLRCGARADPTYTLHAMDADGANIECLSYHETHEWHPSVAHDGRIVYTRWDYVDRDTNVAHHPWTTTPDGRDARAMQGNYPGRRNDRPWMELDIRAIPGSAKFVATAAPHHGQAYGSLVIVDPDVIDDGAMAPVRRFTPHVRFPEGEGGRQCYATAWPLSGHVHLCAYDAGQKDYALYLVDAFGNRELLHRSADLACLSPVPLKPRPHPPAVARASERHVRETAPALNQAARAGDVATAILIDVCNGRKPWPADTTITALRIIQLLPKTTPSNNQPRIGIANQGNARAVLGTVPVEVDGSAHFTVPAGRPVYFQALDQRGLAVQSMRSVTYFQTGEVLACQGCHERRHRAPAAPQVPLAVRRPPSAISPGVDGSNPFNYPRLVQPVLDRHCVNCHARNEAAIDLSDTPAGRNGWSASYTNLTKKHAFYFNSHNGSFGGGFEGGDGARTTPGRFGARAAALLQLLERGHHGVSLSPADLHRITLWLDVNSDFYGAYADTKAQARGEIVRPTLE